MDQQGDVPGLWQKLRDIWDAVVVLAILGGLGRAARWARRERMGPRRWSLNVVAWETILALFSGFVGGGLADALSLGQRGEWAVIILLAYFGPEFIEDLVLRFRDRELPPQAETPSPPPNPPKE